MKNKDHFFGPMLVWILVIIVGTAAVTWLFVQPDRAAITQSMNNTAVGLLVFGSAQPGIFGGITILAAGLKDENREHQSSMFKLGIGAMVIGGFVPPIILSLCSPSLLAWLNG